MLPKSRRIQRKEFGQLLTSGRRHNSEHLILFVLKNPLLKPGLSKFAFSVSKKVSPKAVQRNTMRRRGYSVVSKHLDRIKGGFMCFFSFKKGSNPLSFDVLSREVGSLLSDSGVLL